MSLGCRTYASLSYRIPIQAARAPVMDYIASEGANGI